MISNSILGSIEKEAKNFFQKMSFDVEVRVEHPKDVTVPVNVKMADPKILIGERGQTLADIQRLLKAILKRELKDTDFYIDLDINGYKKKKIEYLKEIAHSIADQVVFSKKEIELPSMPAYERRIIHLELASRTDIATESFGQEPQRKVVVRPYP